MKGPAIEIYGDSGTGKTTMAIILAAYYTKKGMEVVFIDTERNIPSPPAGIFARYEYIPDAKQVMEFIKNFEFAKKRILIIDSIGAPILGHFSSMTLKERGEILLSMYSAIYNAVIKINKNGGLLIVTNQPTSELANPLPPDMRKPFGDKSKFFFKEILSSTKIYPRAATIRGQVRDEVYKKLLKIWAVTSNHATVFEFKAYRSRIYPDGTVIYYVTRKDDDMWLLSSDLNIKHHLKVNWSQEKELLL